MAPTVGAKGGTLKVGEIGASHSPLCTSLITLQSSCRGWVAVNVEKTQFFSNTFYVSLYGIEVYIGGSENDIYDMHLQ